MSSILEEVADAFIEGYKDSGEDTMYAEHMAVEYLVEEQNFSEDDAKAYVKHNMNAINGIAFN